MSTTELQEKCQDLEKQILEKVIDETGYSQPILDGIVNLRHYLMAKYRILWILKEPYDDVEDDGKPCGGGWSLCRDFLNTDSFIKRINKSAKTWHPVIYTTYGILHNFLHWEDVDFIRNNPSMVDIIKSIAVINVKKLPGLTRTYGQINIKQAYESHKDILLKQIEVYNPDIIIGGSTLHFFYDDLGIKNKMIKKESLSICETKSRLYIAAYHPAQIGKTWEKYMDEIVNIVEDWAIKPTTHIVGF